MIAQAELLTAFDNGEWYSHPPGAGSNPSDNDVYLLVHLAQKLDSDGLPAIMMIVGETETSCYIGYSDNS